MREDIRERIEMIKRGEVPKGYKKTKLGIIPNDWEVVQIKDCLERVDNPVNVEAERKYIQIGIRSHGKGLFYKEEVTGKELGNKKVYWIEPNCFIVNIVFAWEQAIGKTIEDEAGMIASHRFPMYRPIGNRILVDYLIQYFMTSMGERILKDASPGGAGRNKTLGQDRFMKSYIVCPPYNEQGRIAEILIKYNNLFFKQDELIKVKQRQKKWFMQNLLTAKKHLSGFKAKWEETNLTDFLAEVNQKSVKNNEYPVLTSSRKGIFFQKDYFQKQVASKENIGYKIVNRGEFTYRTMSDDGNYTFNIQNICEKGIISPAYSVFCVNEKIAVPQYVYYMMNNFPFKKYIKILQQGGTRQSLKFTKLCNISIAIPKFEEQKAIAKVLATADKEIELLEKQLEQIKLEKKAMMQLLLTGIVRVVEK